MSLRQHAKILGIAPSYLSMMNNGKRPWKPEIKDRYDQLVNSLPKSVHKTSKKESGLGGAGTYLLGTKHNHGGRYKGRTCDLCDVNAAL